MKTKIVLWGTDEKDQKILIALELLAEQSKVILYTFPESSASEEFVKQMMDEWRNGKEVSLPDGHTKEERELSVNGSLLPEHIKVERGDIIQRAQTEWHFIVLSAKLHRMYEAELNDFKEKIEKLSSYDTAIWESLKGFWAKVQEQVRERNLFREHANTLRDNTNALFSKMKELRSALDEEFKSLSKEHFEQFMQALQEIEDKAAQDKKLQAVFDELKQLQRKFRETKLTRDHRTKVWERLDAAFKSVKEKRFGPNAVDSSPLDRLTRRYKGLLNAIQKMERSIRRDHEELDFQNKKIASTDGQLEAQIRQAKLKMIEERIRSKEKKLKEMIQTREELEKRMKSLKDKEAKRADREKVQAARKAAKDKIAQEIKKAEEARTGDNEQLEKAADALSEKNEQDSVMDAITNTMGEALEDVVDTVKAVAEVLGDKIETAVKEVKEKVEDNLESVSESAPATKADDLKAIEGIGPKIEQLLHDANIKSYQQLAASKPDALKAILTGGGKRYASHDPGTWPAQAAFAAKGEWDQLKAWQDQLDGGRVMADKSEEE